MNCFDLIQCLINLFTIYTYSYAHVRRTYIQTRLRHTHNINNHRISTAVVFESTVAEYNHSLINADSYIFSSIPKFYNFPMQIIYNIDGLQSMKTKYMHILTRSYIKNPHILNLTKNGQIYVFFRSF